MDEKTIKDEVLNKNSDFYAQYLELKRSKTPMAMREAINKYKDILGKLSIKNCLRPSLRLLKRFNPDAGTSNIRFASLEEVVKMMNSEEVNWKKNTQKYFLNKFRMEERKEGRDLRREAGRCLSDA